MSGERQWVMTITLDANAPDDEAQAFMNAIADLAATHEPRTYWDAIVIASFEPTG